MYSTDVALSIAPDISPESSGVAAAVAPVMKAQLYGRSAEVGQALRVFREVLRARAGAVIVIGGEPGVGKTAVRAAVAEQAARMGFTVRSATAERGQQGVSLAPVLLAMRSTDHPLLSDEQLTALVPLHDHQVWLWERIAIVLEERAREAPLTISIDDVHLLDPNTRSAMRVLFQRLSGSPVVWLLTTQTQPGGSTHDVVGQALDVVANHHIPLSPLSAEAIAALAADRLGGVPDARVRRLLEGATGNALLAVELVDGVRAQRAGGSSLSDAGAVPLPRPLVERVLVRVRTIMGPSGIQLLQAGSVLDQSFTIDGAALLLQESPKALMLCLNTAVRGGLIADDGQRISFRHDLVRQALYEDLPPSSRRIMHRSVARNLVAAGRPAIEIAPHLLVTALGGDSIAVSMLSDAAQSVAERSPLRAVELLDGAIGLVAPGGHQEIDVGCQRVAALVRVGRTTDALEFGERLFGETLAGDPAGQLVVALAPALWSSGRHDAFRSRIEVALTGEGLSDATRARLLSCRALASSRSGRGSGVRSVGEEALAHAQRLGDTHAEATASWALGETAMHEGRHVDAVVHLGARRTLAGFVSADEILASVQLGDFDLCEKLLGQARREMDEDRSPEQESSLLAARAAHQLTAGSLVESERNVRALLRLSEHSGDRSMRNLAGSLLSHIALLHGDVQLARRHLLDARAAAGDHCDDVLLDCVEALLADAEDDPVAAATVLGNGALDRLLVQHRWSRDWIITAVRIGIRANDVELAKEAAQLASDYAVLNESSTGAAAWSDQAQGLLTDDADRLGRAARLLEETSPRSLVRRAEVHEDYGRALLRAGRRTEAIASLDTSWRIFRRIEAAGSARRVQRHLQAAGAPRRRFTSAAPRASNGWAALTPAEEKIACLIADGHTNREAAAALVLSPHTISTHLRAVFSKLGVNSRVQLTRLVMEHMSPASS